MAPLELLVKQLNHSRLLLLKRLAKLTILRLTHILRESVVDRDDLGLGARHRYLLRSENRLLTLLVHVYHLDEFSLYLV